MKNFFGHALISAVTISVFFAPNANAQLAVESVHIDSTIPQIDGNLSDWDGLEDDSNQLNFVMLNGSEIVSGGDGWEDDQDFSADIAFAHSNRALYFAAKLNDQTIVRTKNALTSEDHVELRFALAKGSMGEFRSFAIGIYSDPANNQIEVRRLKNGKNRASAVIPGIEAAISGTENEYSIEVAIPWSLLPLGAAKRAGMRSAVYLVDCDEKSGRLEDTVLGTSSIEGRINHEKLPILGQSDITRPLDMFWKKMNLSPKSSTRFFAIFDLGAGKELEQVMVVGNHLLAFGPEIDNEDQYAFIPLPVKSQAQVVNFEYFDATGNGKKDVILEFEEQQGDNFRRWTAVYRLNQDLEFQKVFSAATLMTSFISRVENKLRFIRKPNQSMTIKVTPGKIRGIEEALGDPIPELDGTRMVVPWDKPASATFTYSKGQYKQAERVK